MFYKVYINNICNITLSAIKPHNRQIGIIILNDTNVENLQF